MTGIMLKYLHESRRLRKVTALSHFGRGFTQFTHCHFHWHFCHLLEERCKMARWLPIESNPEVSGESDVI